MFVITNKQFVVSNFSLVVVSININLMIKRGRRDRMVLGFIITHAIGAYHC